MTTLATYVEMPAPRRPTEAADESLPADLTVAFGAAEAPVPGSVPLHDFLRTAGALTYEERLVLVDQALLLLERQLRAPAAEVGDARGEPGAAAAAAARPAGSAEPRDDGRRVASSTREMSGDLPLGARPAHQLPAARAVRRQDRVPAVPGESATRDGGGEHYVVTRVAAGVFRARRSGRASRSPHWNGMPIARAVDAQRRPVRRQQRRPRDSPRRGVADHPPAAHATCRRTRSG